MHHHPDFFNVRKIVVFLALGQIALLSLFAVLDLAMPKADSMQASKTTCVQPTLGGIGIPQTSQQCP